MVGEAIAGLSAIKTAFDIAKGLKDIDDAARRNAAVIDLQEKILTAQRTQSQLLDQVRLLEEQLSGFQKWEIEKNEYELKEIHPGTFAYAIKAEARQTKPEHLICAACYEHRKKSILQWHNSVKVICPECNTTFRIKDQSHQLQRRTISRGPEF